MPSARPKVDFYGHYAYLILHFPILRRRGFGEKTDEEVDFVIGKEFLITVRYGAVEGMSIFEKSFEMESLLGRGDGASHAGILFFDMMKKLYETAFFQTERIKDSVVDIERKIFLGHEREMVFQLSKTNRDLIDFRRAISLHKDTLESFEVISGKIFGDDYRFFIRAIMGEYQKVEKAVRNNNEYVIELRDTNDALLNTKQNQIMQFLTVVAFIGMPLTIITALLQIDTVSRPIIGQENDFWIITGALIALGLGMYVFFKKKKWL